MRIAHRVLYPMSSAPVRMSTPAMTSRLAKVCRRQCQVKSFRPAAATAGSNQWRAFRTPPQTNSERCRIFHQLTNFSLHLGCERAAESNGMARFDDWFVANPSQRSKGLTVGRPDHNFALMAYFGALLLRFVVVPSGRFPLPADRLVGTNFYLLPFSPYRN